MEIDIKPNQVIREYRFKHTIGSGAYGVVWQAHHELMDTTVAIKVIDTYDLDARDLERIVYECRIWGQLENKEHVVEMWNAFQEGDRFFIVMELMNNSLKRYLREHRHPNFGLTLDWALDLCTALEQIHAKGIVHRDIKPQNILLTGDAQVKLSDFGVAHIPESSLTTRYQPRTPDYCAPEQKANQSVDSGADVYSLCAVLLEIWTGRKYSRIKGLGQHSLSEDNVRDEMALLLTENYPDLSTGLRDRLTDIVLAGLRDRLERISLEDLQTVLCEIKTDWQREKTDDQVVDIAWPHPARTPRVKFEELYDQALVQTQKGEWAEAVKMLNEALQDVERSATPRLWKQLAEWQEVEQATRYALQAGNATMGDTRDAYTRLAQQDDFSVIATTLSTILGALEKVEQRIIEVENLARAAGGYLSQATIDLQNDVHIFCERLGIIQEAVIPYPSRDGVVKVQNLLQVWSDDPTLEALIRKLRDKTNEQELSELLKRSDAAIERGDWANALDLLRQAQKFKPTGTEIATRYTVLQRNQQLEQKLQQIDADYQNKLATNSLKDAVEALRSGLVLLLDKEAVLPPETRGILQKLVALGRDIERFASRCQEYSPMVQELLSQLEVQSRGNWAVQRAYQLGKQWIQLVSKIAQQGVIASGMALGNYEETYRDALAYLKDRPTDEDAHQEVHNIRNRWIGHLNQFTQKRQRRARQALKEEFFELALSELDRIEKEFYGPVEREFPGFFNDRPDVEQIRKEARQLATTAKKLQSLYTQATPLLRAAEQAYLKGELEAAEQELRKARLDVQDSPDLMQRVDDLQARIDRACIEQTCDLLDRTIIGVQIKLRLFETRKDLANQLEILNSLPQQINFSLLATGKQDEYYQLLDQVQERLDLLEACTAWEAQADEAWQRQGYDEAIWALERALASAQRGEKRVALEIRLEQAKRLRDVS